jgi:proteic killer suppression protein
MIKSFKGKIAESIFNGIRSPRFPDHLQKTARRKLKMIDSAHNTSDLTVFPGNRFEVLKGDRDGRSSIRINDQYRICFFWDGVDAYDVEIVDYHT